METAAHRAGGREKRGIGGSHRASPLRLYNFTHICAIRHFLNLCNIILHPSLFDFSYQQLALKILFTLRAECDNGGTQKSWFVYPELNAQLTRGSTWSYRPEGVAPRLIEVGVVFNQSLSYRMDNSDILVLVNSFSNLP